MENDFLVFSIFILLESFQAGCNDALTEPNGAIYSPGYPAPYTNNLDCTTTVTAPVGEKVLLEFTAFHVQKFTYHQCPSDYLILTDGSFSKKYCGKKKDMPSFYHSKNNQLTIQFKTNYRYAYAGYFATYKFVNGRCIDNMTYDKSYLDIPHTHRACGACRLILGACLTQDKVCLKVESYLRSQGA